MSARVSCASWLGIFASISITASSAHAVVVARYEFSGTSLASTDVEATSAAGDVQFGPGLPGTVVGAGGNPANSLNVQASETTGTETGAIAGDDYIFFTVTPGAAQLDLTSLTFDVGASGGAGASTTYVRSSADGFAANIGTVAQVGTSFTPGLISLSDAAFQNLASPITFRFYLSDNSTGGTIRYDNITLNADVPEPACAGIVLLATIAMGRRHRARAARLITRR